ncbi:MAG: hypothetical protein ACRC1T_09830 [Clostridium chrysemydis]|uniref:hypothetical protein n=1 Tax=Clostridium chrysemydis TaxID=2665504 RepID=UPI003F3D44BF
MGIGGMGSYGGCDDEYEYYYDYEDETTKMKEKRVYCWNCGKDITGLFSCDCRK